MAPGEQSYHHVKVVSLSTIFKRSVKSDIPENVQPVHLIVDGMDSFSLREESGPLVTLRGPWDLLKSLKPSGSGGTGRG